MLRAPIPGSIWGFIILFLLFGSRLRDWTDGRYLCELVDGDCGIHHARAGPGIGSIVAHVNGLQRTRSHRKTAQPAKWACWAVSTSAPNGV
ncbi:hypothetical protein N007_15090 [Alicyclobacillus acidoterrestris ATCC 49025]|nr:hypothetical protein N007_15090 [Alicyclobacillus acidoterrestris ATCC 49025]